MRSNVEIKITLEELKPLLLNPKNSGTNQLACDCPYCGKTSHFFINKVTFLWDCKKCKEAGNVAKLLYFLNVAEQYTHKTLKLDSLVILNDGIEEKEELVIKKIPNKPLPRNFQRIYDNEYLIRRGLKKNDFYKYKIGVTDKISKLKDYVIFLIEEQGECKGFVCRNVLDSKIIELNELLRYRNSTETKFADLLFGFEEIDKRTDTVIVVEGIFDKIRLDNLLNVDDYPYLKIVSSFGNKMSDMQILKLKKTNVKNLILFYDLDATEETKKNALKIKKHFNLRISCLTNGKDPGDSEEEDVINALQNTYSYNTFFYEKCNGRKIKVI